MPVSSRRRRKKRAHALWQAGGERVQASKERLAEITSGRSHFQQGLTPTVVYRLTRRWFALADSEVKVDWQCNRHTSCISGIEIGYMFSRRVGALVKGEIPWGQYREGDWFLGEGSRRH